MPRHEVETYSISQCNEKLLDFRKKGIRSSELVSLMAKKILKANPDFSKISDKHAALEQCCMAAIDYNDIGLAKKLFNLVNEDFPKDSSNRCYKLHLMLFENSNPVPVQEERDALLEKNNTDQSLLKRQAALKLQENQLEPAVALLVEHLKTFSLDEDSWMCLADCYIELGQYNKAAFCMEEIVMMKPHTAHYHIRLAEIYYTWASMSQNLATKDVVLENYLTSKYHYAYAIRLTLKMTTPNLRAIFGWMQASRAVNGLRNLKSETEGKLIQQENITMSFMTNTLLKTNLAKLHQGDTIKGYLEELNLESLSLNG